ncbi:MAG TPA: hypothetical protein PKU80_08725 [Candidatus Limiplasma sp.]|nr:hypothetical protein [Candidatus Limiplasma sp.]HRX07824.1 hypothetical protein [Candidatus Limiplasma sp.]
MKKHTRKLIAPIVITVLILLYFIGFIIVAATTDWLPLGWMIALIVIPLCLGGVMVYVLVQRIKEIRSGEEDDLSQY